MAALLEDSPMDGGSVVDMDCKKKKPVLEHSDSENFGERLYSANSDSFFEDTEEFLLPRDLGVQAAASSPSVHLAVKNSNGYEKSASERNFASLTDSEVILMTSGHISGTQKPSSIASEKKESKLSLTTNNSAAKLTNAVNCQSSKENVSGKEEGTAEASHSRSSSPKGSSKSGSDKGNSTGGNGASQKFTTTPGSIGGQVGPGQQAAQVGRIQSAATSIRKIIAPNYKSRNEEFRKLFRKVPDSEKFVIDYSCAFQKEILHQGRMYLSQGSVCFYANIFGKWETNLVIRLKDIASVTKEKTAKVIPNAIQIVTRSTEKYFFASFATRDKSFMMLFKLWQSALLDQVISPQDLWAWAQHGYDIEDLPVSDMDIDLDMINDEIGGISSSAEAGSIKIEPVFMVGSPDSDEVQSVSAELPTIVGVKTIRSENQLKLTSAATPPVTGKPRHRKKSGGGVGKKHRGGSGPVPLMTSTPGPADNFSESSENDVEHTCPCAMHEGQELINKVYPLSVDQMFILLFTDSAFYRNFHDMRKTTDLELGDWVVDSDGMKTRNVAYTMNLNHSMAPKTAGITEKQTCTQHGKCGQVYVLRVEAQNLGVPYAENFYVSSVYCLSKVSQTESRLRCHANVVFRKSMWGIVKSFIEKNSFLGMQEHFQELDKYLRQECTRLGLPAEVETPEPKRAAIPAKRHLTPRSGDRSRSRRREPRIGYSPISSADGRQYGFTGLSTFLPQEIEWIAKAILLTMVVMLLLNVVLFYKLWSLEGDTGTRPRSMDYYSLEGLKYMLDKSELSTEDLLRLYKTHQDLAAQRWLTALQGTVGSLSHIEEELHKLRQQLNEAQTEFSFFSTESQRLKDRGRAKEDTQL